MARARAFAEAVDLGVALRATLTGPEWSDGKHELWVKEQALAPEPPFANVRSLAYLEDDFFTYWNESSGEHVEQFWQRVAERGLPFQRKDTVRDVLTRGHIRTEVEYHTITDSLVVLQQTGKISAAEVDKLGEMLRQFENRARR